MSPAPTQNKVTVKAVFVIAALMIIIAGLKSSAELLAPLLLAIFFSMIAAAPLPWLISRGVKEPIAITIAIALVIFIIFGLGGVISASLGDFSEVLPHYADRLKKLSGHVVQWLASYQIVTPGNLMADLLDPGAIMSYITGALGRLTSVFSGSLLILLLVIFILLELSHFPLKLQAMLGADSQSGAYFRRFQLALNRYLVIKTGISILTGITVWLMLLVIGVDFALLWGLLAFLLNYIPNIGSLIAAIPPVLLALIDAGPSKALITVAGYFLINNIYGSVLEPRVLGRELGLSTLVVFISLIFWGWVFGPVGMLLSVPLTMVLKIAFEVQDETRWVAVMLSDHKQVRALVTAKAAAEKTAPS